MKSKYKSRTWWLGHIYSAFSLVGLVLDILVTRSETLNIQPTTLTYILIANVVVGQVVSWLRKDTHESIH